MLTATKNFVWTICCRFLNGIATGGMDAAALTWTAEIASQHHRGRMVGILMCLAATGASTVYFMMYGLSAHSTGGLVWRLPVAFQLVFITVMIPAVFVLPESPRWMVKVGMIADARIVLRSLHASGDSSDAAVENDLQAIIDAHAEAARDLSSTSYWRMLLVPDEYATVRRTWSALFVQFSTQALIGASFVGGYGISIFVTGGWSTHLASLLVGVSIVTQAVSGLCGVMWSEKMGRRYAMVGGALMGCALLALIGMCGYFVNKHSIGNPGLAKQYGGVTVALLLLWCAQFGATWRKYIFLLCDSTKDRPCTDVLTSVVPFHLPLRDFPATIPGQRELVWYCRFRHGIFSCEHGQHVSLRGARVQDDVLTLRL